MDGIYKSQPTTYPLLQNRWANKFLGLGDGRIIVKKSSDADNTYKQHTKSSFLRDLPDKKQEETKRKRTYLKTQQFSSYFNLSMRKLFYYYLRRPFMGFVFVSNTGRAGLPSRAAFYLEPGCPNQGRPEECLEKLIFSLPIPKNQLSNHKSTTENFGIHGTDDRDDGTHGMRDERRDATRVRFFVGERS